MNFGARGDGTGNDSEAIQKTIDACSKAGGGRVVIPSGKVCRCGPVKLRSHIDFHVESGARVEAIPDIKLYPEYGLTSLGGEGQKWIHADDMTLNEFIVKILQEVMDQRKLDDIAESITPRANFRD